MLQLRLDISSVVSNSSDKKITNRLRLGDFLSPPNLISLVRLLSAPIVAYLILNNNFVTASYIFFLASLTDWFDGYLARSFDAESVLGRLLDPIADKVLVVTTYTVLGLKGFFPAWLVSLIICRDILIVMAAIGIVISQTKVPLVPVSISKINTTLQLVLVLFVLLSCSPIPAQIDPFSFDFLLIKSLMYGVGLTTFLSGYVYLMALIRNLRLHKSR